MANRRSGGMLGGNQRTGGLGSGNRSFSQQPHHHPFQGNNVSPWQGNSMPPSNSSSSYNQSGGNTGGGGGGGGGGSGGGAAAAAGTGGGLLNHLATNPQQLALALTNLLQPQQQQQQLTNPPSLLSLNTSPAFSHQDNRDSFNRFGNRGRSDFRRNEPYKSRNGGWRQMDSGRGGPNRQRNSFGGRGSGGGGGGGDKNRQSTPSKNIKSNEKPKNEPQTNEEQSNENTKTEPNVSGEENDENRSGGGVTAAEEQNETTENIKIEEEIADDDGGDQDQDDRKQEQGGGGSSSADGKYHGIPSKLLRCHVCNKNMWDGESFQKHVRGRAHKQMLQSMEESFHIVVNILRENMRLVEEKKLIELNRMHRLSKNKYSRKYQDSQSESHCNMCDLKFLGKIIAHRKTAGHQRLKRFLHPSCVFCNKEFPSRMDWIEHRLTPEHLRQLNEHLKKTTGGTDGEIIEDDLEIDLEPLLEECMEIEDEHPILELNDDLNNLQNRIPAHKKNRPLGTQTIKPFTGFMCEICHRSFTTEELAQAHLKTENHYYSFIDAIKRKYKKQTEEAAAAAAAAEAESRKRKREDQDDEGGAEGGDNNESGGGDAGGDNKNLNETTETNESTLNGKDQEMYDPEEACNDGEEAADKTVESGENIEETQQNKEGNSTEQQKQEVDEEIKKDVSGGAGEEGNNNDDNNQQEQQQDAEQSVTNSPRVTRRTTAAAASTVTGGVKNGACPKSKKAKK